jgi:iron complex transport system substrate-binding protein
MRRRRSLDPALWAGILVLAAGTGASGGDRSAPRRDALGVDLPPGPPAERIVSLSPNLTEILFAIGVERERIVGVTRFCDHPPEVEGLERIGGIVDPSVERIVSLRPDLVLATRGNPAAIVDRLRASGLNVFALESQDGLGRILETMQVLIEILAPRDAPRADSLLGAFRSRLACLRTLSSAMPDSMRPRVYYYDPISPDWTAGPGTHISEAIALAGGRNIADQASTAWPRYAVEALLVQQPDRILVAVAGAGADGGEEAASLADLRERPGWRSLRAVREGGLCPVPADWLMRPGPRVLEAVVALGRCLHPERSWECDP